MRVVNDVLDKLVLVTAACPSSAPLAYSSVLAAPQSAVAAVLIELSDTLSVAAHELRSSGGFASLSEAAAVDASISSRAPSSTAAAAAAENAAVNALKERISSEAAAHDAAMSARRQKLQVRGSASRKCVRECVNFALFFFFFSLSLSLSLFQELKASLRTQSLSAAVASEYKLRCSSAASEAAARVATQDLSCALARVARLREQITNEKAAHSTAVAFLESAEAAAAAEVEATQTRRSSKAAALDKETDALRSALQRDASAVSEYTLRIEQDTAAAAALRDLQASRLPSPSSARALLDALRSDCDAHRRQAAATLLQARFRGYSVRKKALLAKPKKGAKKPKGKKAKKKA